MTKEDQTDLADRLMAADSSNLEPSPVPSSRSLEDVDAAFEELLATERKTEARVQRVALISWSIAFVCLVLSAAGATFVSGGDAPFADVVRTVMIVTLVTGVVSFLAASLSSLVWLFRSRTASLKVIERRLAALENLLTTRR